MKTNSCCRRFIRRNFIASLCIAVASAIWAAAPVVPSSDQELSFTAAGDQRYYYENTKPDGKRWFDGACEAIKQVGPGAFLFSPGDIDQPVGNRRIIDRVFGPEFPWYIVVGNHEVENAEAMEWVRPWFAGPIPGVVRRGVPGTALFAYSFDVGNSHFVAIDSYPAAKEGKTLPAGKVAPPGDKGPMDITDAHFKWLEEDLAATKKPYVFVLGHLPIQSQPDMDNGRLRHAEDSVSSDPARAERFVALLKKYKVRAYLCGHTHNTSVVKLKSGIWQVDSGHARGAGDPGALSSFVKFRVAGEHPEVDIYRADPDGREYTLRKTVVLN